MSFKGSSIPSLSQLGGVPIQTGTTPRSLLSQVQALCTSLSVSGPVCWISPREAFSDSGRATACTDGSLVQTMRDITGNGYNALQSTSAYRPVFRQNGLNNLYPALDSGGNNPPNGGMVVSNLFAASGFSAGYTIYAVATSGGLGSINPANFDGAIADLVGLSNDDYLSIQSSNQMAGSYNGGATGLTWNPQPGTTYDWSGVYVTSYNGTTAYNGKNGQINSKAISGTVPTSGHLCIGGSYQYLGSGGIPVAWTGLVGDVLVFTGVHTIAQMQAISGLLAQDSGVVPPAFLAVGDSRTEGYGLASTSTMNYFAQMCELLGANNSNCLPVNVGTVGWTLEQMVSDNATSPWLRSHIVSAARGSQNLALIWGGINSMSSGGSNESAATAFASLQTLCAAYRSTNCKVAVMTELPASASSAGAGYDARRLAFNQLIYQAGSSLYDILVDFGANSVMGPASALTNTALYQADEIHPTEQGQAILAQIAAEAIQAYYSETPILQIPGNTYPVGSYPGSRQQQLAPCFLTGKTAGNVQWSMPSQGSGSKKFVAIFTGYENDTATNQTITFPTPFTQTPVVLGSISGLTVSASTTTFTITSPDSVSTFSGTIVIEGI